MSHFIIYPLQQRSFRFARFFGHLEGLLVQNHLALLGKFQHNTSHNFIDFAFFGALPDNLAADDLRCKPSAFLGIYLLIGPE